GLAFERAALHGQMQQMQRAQAAYPDLPQAWREASTVSDYTIPLTAEGAKALVEKLQQILWEAMAAAPALGSDLPQDMRPFTIVLHAAPHVGEPAAGEAE